MKLTKQSSFDTVVALVAGTLARSRIRAVLTGGACATFYSAGDYKSWDLDFILQSNVTRDQMDAVMAGIGFHRKGDHYVHPRTRFFVEFPAGPLGIGSDIEIRPIVRRIGGTGVRTLSATDACRDRLAAFYHWSDRQSLEAAVQIASRRRVNLTSIKNWSEREGFTDKLAEFLGSLRSTRKNKAPKR